MAQTPQDPHDSPDNFTIPNPTTTQKKSIQDASNVTSVNIGVELHQLLITGNIVNYVRSVNKILATGKKNPRSTVLFYELLNCIERFLLYLANMGIEHENTGNKYKIYSIVGSNVNITDGVAQLGMELVRKKIVGKEIINNVCGKIIGIIRKGISVPESQTAKQYNIPSCSVSYKKSTGIIGLVCGDAKSKHPLVSVLIRNFRNIESLAIEGDPQSALILALRYSAFITGGNHWSLPKKYYNYLYFKCGVRNEGFASIINTKALQHPDSKFCSIFPDIEAKYGSLGSFFHNNIGDVPGNWVVNPPYTEKIINESIVKVLGDLKSAKIKNVIKAVYMILPNWENLDGLDLLLKSPFLLKAIIVKPGEMYFEMQNQMPYTLKTEQFYCILYNNIGIDKNYDDTLTDGLTAIKKFKPGTQSTSSQSSSSSSSSNSPNTHQQSSTKNVAKPPHPIYTITGSIFSNTIINV
jgi:hypothetical protein